MPDIADILQYRHFRKPAFSFVTATAPTTSDPNYVAGSNLMTSYKGYVEKRPGFDVGLEPTPTSFTDQIQRIFTWRRWGGTFYIMLCTVGTVAKVWKLALGVDSSFSVIFTSAGTEPFDFVVSNNFCFFGNGTENRKFDGTTVWNWGISIGSIAESPNAYCNTAADGGGAHAWSNPTNAQGPPDGSDAVNNGTAPAHGSFTSNNLFATNYGGFSVGTGDTILGIQITVTGSQTLPPGSASTAVNLNFYLTYNGVAIGTAKYASFYNSSSPGSNVTVSLGGSSDLWGATLNANVVADGTFGVICYGFIGNGGGGSSRSCTFGVDAIQITVSKLGGPTITVSGTAGSFSASNGGYQYVYCYSNSNTGHISSPTPPSAASGNFSSKLNIGITVVASTDPQVTNIRLFRTTDGGGGQFFEVANSPYPNASGTITDNTADVNLSIISAPTFEFNDPPPPMKGMVWFANRIWGFNNNSVYFTDWEEMNIGVPEEGCTSGPQGNFWNFSTEVTGLSVAQDGILIFLPGAIYKISGDSLSNFWRTTVAGGLGCRNRATITRLGGLTAFLANTNSVWTTDSTSLNELSANIQPTIDNIDQSQASMAFHFQGQYRWLLLCDPSHNQTIPFDVNTEQWIPPWSIVGTAVTTGETSPGVFTLLLANRADNKMLQMIPNQYTDDGAAYGMSGTLNCIPLVNEHLSSGSPIIDLFYPQAPEHVAMMEYVAMETNALLPTSVKRMFDDDPNTATYVDNTSNAVNSPLKTVVQGTNVLDKWYYDRAWSGKRVSIQFNYAPAANNPKIYTMTIAYKQVR